jgi:four helix bundle protein
MFGFEKLDVYNKGIDFTKEIYQLSAKFPGSEKFGVTNQLRRAAVSVVLNIAEGNGRSTKGYIHFLKVARGSLNECIAVLDITLALGYIKKRIRDNLYSKIEELSKMLGGLIKSLKRRQG